MEFWQLGLYAAASVLALKSLTTLMANHRNRVRRDAAIASRLQQMSQEMAASASAETKKPPVTAKAQ